MKYVFITHPCGACFSSYRSSHQGLMQAWTLTCCPRKSKQKDGRKLFIQRLCRLFIFSVFYFIAIFMNISKVPVTDFL